VNDYEKDERAAMGPFQDDWTMADVEAVIARGDPQELLYVPIVVSMNPPDCTRAQQICIDLATHSHPNVRSNALLGFAHLARNCRWLDEAVVRPIVEAALQDETLRGRALDVADDLEVFLGWRIERNVRR